MKNISILPIAGGWQIQGEGGGFIVTKPETILELLYSLGQLTGSIDIRCPGVYSMETYCKNIGRYMTIEMTGKASNFVCEKHMKEWQEKGIQFYDIMPKIIGAKI